MRAQARTLGALVCGDVARLTGLAADYEAARALLHRLAQIPVDDQPAVAVQHAAQIVERAGDVDVAHVDMPMLMRLRWLFKAGAFLRWLPLPFPQQPRFPQYPPHARRTHRHDVGVQHHERQPPIALQRILQMEIDDCLLFPILEPKVPGNPTVVFVDASVAFSPIVELARTYAQPSDESSGADLTGLRPAPHEIHDLIPHIVRYPDPVQSSPSSFFNATYSPINSARAPFLAWIFFPKNPVGSRRAWVSGGALAWKGGAPFP